MRRTLAIAVLLSASSLSAHAVEVKGPWSCGEWIRYRAEQNSWQYVSEVNWLIGYLSGLAVARNKDFLVGTDVESIELWVDNYCRANPLARVDDAGILLAAELMKRKGL